MRNQHEDQFIVRALLVFGGEEVAEKRDRRKPRNSVDRLALVLLQDPAHDVGFTFAHANFVLDLALPDDWLLNAADILVRIHGRDVHRQLQRHFVSSVNMRRDIDIHADVNVIELRVDQRIDADATDSGLKRAGRHRNTLADLQRSLLSVKGTYLWLLQDLGIAVGIQEVGGRRRNRDLKIGGIQVRQAVQVDGTGGACRSW